MKSGSFWSGVEVICRVRLHSPARLLMGSLKTRQSEYEGIEREGKGEREKERRRDRDRERSRERENVREGERERETDKERKIENR